MKDLVKQLMVSTHDENEGEKEEFDEVEDGSRRTEAKLRIRNAVTEGRYAVFGVYAMQLLSAAIYALAFRKNASPSNGYNSCYLLGNLDRHAHTILVLLKAFVTPFLKSLTLKLYRFKKDVWYEHVAMNLGTTGTSNNSSNHLEHPQTPFEHQLINRLDHDTRPSTIRLIPFSLRPSEIKLLLVAFDS
nr:pyridoxal phosphate-dependent transferase [Tanacetum cinerariifolium]